MIYTSRIIRKCSIFNNKRKQGIFNSWTNNMILIQNLQIIVLI